MSLDGFNDADISALLKRVRTFAVVGASPTPDRPSYGVMEYLIRKGYVVKPVNPIAAGQDILGQRAYASLADVPEPADVIDIFRAPPAVPGVVRQAIAAKERLGASVVWMQLGVINDEAIEAAKRAGFTVVVDRCPKIEYARLLQD